MATTPPAKAANDDQLVTEALQARFRASPYWELRKLTCEFKDGIAVLKGRVPSYYLRQVAQSMANSFKEVHAVNDHIEVSSSLEPSFWDV